MEKGGVWLVDEQAPQVQEGHGVRSDLSAANF